MKLAAYQRAMVALSFAEQPPEMPELTSFALYRPMIRGRLFAMAELAYRRTWALLGDAACAQSFARYLAMRPPRSPIIREVIGDFAAFAELDARLLGEAPPHARDLLRFEAAKWYVASVLPATPAPCALREVDFDGVLVQNPTLVRLPLSYLVAESSDAQPTLAPHTLLVYRRRADDEVRWYRAPALLGELLALTAALGSRTEPGASTSAPLSSPRVPDATESSATLGALVQQLFARKVSDAEASAEQLLEDLASALAVAVERDVLWGVRDP